VDVTSNGEGNVFMFTLINGRWVKTAASKEPSGQFWQVDFVNPHVWMVETSANINDPRTNLDIYRTSDGGQHWQKIATLPNVGTDLPPPSPTPIPKG
jgi:photosystem II stability/assembly factor-like uncharacterized protein